MQSDISHFESSLLAHIKADKVCRVFVENIYVSETIQEELPADGGRQSREEGHGGRVVHRPLVWCGQVKPTALPKSTP
jgi:hypothetical protein